MTGTYRAFAVDAQTGTETELSSSPLTVGMGTSCALDGLTVPDGFSHTFYSTKAPVAPDTCNTVDKERICTNGVLSGRAMYKYASCTDPVAATYGSVLTQVAGVLGVVLGLLY